MDLDKNYIEMRETDIYTLYVPAAQSVTEHFTAWFECNQSIAIRGKTGLATSCAVARRWSAHCQGSASLFDILVGIISK